MVVSQSPQAIPSLQSSQDLGSQRGTHDFFFSSTSKSLRMTLSLAIRTSLDQFLFREILEQ